MTKKNVIIIATIALTVEATVKFSINEEEKKIDDIIANSENRA